MSHFGSQKNRKSAEKYQRTMKDKKKFKIINQKMKMESKWIKIKETISLL